MSQISEAINEHFEICKSELPKKFVPWSWVVGLSILVVSSNIGSSILVSDDSNKKNLKIQALELTALNQAEEIKNLKAMRGSIERILEILESRNVRN